MGECTAREIDVKVGERLGRARQDVRLAVPEAARRSGIAEARIEQFETGYQQVLFLEAMTLADLYGVPLRALLE